MPYFTRTIRNRMLPLGTWHDALRQNIEYVKYRLSLLPQDAQRIVFVTDLHVGCGYGVRFNAYSRGKAIDEKADKVTRGGSTKSEWYNNTNAINRLDRICVALKKLTEQVRIDLVVLGGDYLSNTTSTTADSAKNGLYEVNSCIRKLTEFVPVIICKGNHDTNTLGNFDRNVSNGEFVELMYDGIKRASNVVYSEDGLFGYCDFPKQKARVIWLNTADIDVSELENCTQARNPQYKWFFGQEQLEFLIDALTIKESGWKILTFHHYNWINDTSIADNAGTEYKNAIVNIFASFRSNLRGSFKRESSHGQFKIDVSWDFTDNGKNVYIGGINGHYHKDGISGCVYQIKNGEFIPEKTENSTYRWVMQSISIASMQNNNAYGYEGTGKIMSVNSTASASNSTPYESSFDIISLVGDSIYKTRFGGGLSWEYLRVSTGINRGALIKQTRNATITVKDANGKGIAGAIVRLKFNGCDIDQQTDSNGKAVIDVLPKDKFTLVVLADGYKEQIQEISNATSIINKTITLQKA